MPAEILTFALFSSPVLFMSLGLAPGRRAGRYRERQHLCSRGCRPPEFSISTFFFFAVVGLLDIMLQAGSAGQTMQ